MSRRVIIVAILAVVGALALAALLSRKNSLPTGFPPDRDGTQVPASFEIVRIQDRFAERTAPKEEPQAEAAEPPAIYFSDSKESDG